MLRRYAFTSVMICALLTTQTLSQPQPLHAAVNSGYMAQVASNTYVNPTHEEINLLLEKVAKEKEIPSIILKAIAFKESTWRQFDKQGQPLLSRPEHPAIGIMQVTTYNDNDHETIHKLKTDIEFNIRMGADLLNEKWGFTPTIGDGDRNKLENWYFAIWAYNIWSDRNNPNSLAATNPGTLSYQDKVLRIIAYPEGFLAQYIEPVSLTPIPMDILPASGIPAKNSPWDTPEPFHYGDLDAEDNPDEGSGEQKDPPVEGPGTPSRGGSSETLELVRLAGNNRVETAIEQALSGWPTGAQTVVLARADHFPDALAGVPLAAQYDAPILLTASKALDPSVQEALTTLRPDKVVLLGGEGALGQGISTKLEALGWGNEQQIRVDGLNRYETAANIALTTVGLAPLDSQSSSTASTGSVEAVAIATGQNFPDALSIASIAGIKKMPILLTDSKILPKETLQALNILKPQKVYLIGGEGAINSSIEGKILQELELSSSQLVRLYGDSRYDTMAAVAEAFIGESQGLCFATGQEFPDALAGAALAARLKATVILLPQSSLEKYPRLKNAIIQHPSNPQSQPYIFGGEGAVSPERVEELKSLLRN